MYFRDAELATVARYRDPYFEILNPKEIHAPPSRWLRVEMDFLDLARRCIETLAQYRGISDARIKPKLLPYEKNFSEYATLFFDSASREVNVEGANIAFVVASSDGSYSFCSPSEVKFRVLEKAKCNTLSAGFSE